jgi:hypothetical protein
MGKLTLKTVYFLRIVLLNNCQIVKFVVIHAHSSVLEAGEAHTCPAHHLKSEWLHWT